MKKRQKARPAAPRAELAEARIGVIGGSGLYAMEELADVREIRVKTPFGEPSDAIILGTLAGVRCAFLPRHGRGHKRLPTEVNSRANIWALKSLGVERVAAMGAVGSLREEYAPRHFVFPDQLVDETRHRRSSFFGEGVVAHVAFAHPFCNSLSDLLHETAREAGIVSHRGGVYCCMEGPAFSTRAESELHRKLGYAVIGMTAIGEAKLAREAELCYAPAAMITDYDCWKEGDEVTTEKVVEHLMANVAAAQRLLKAALPKLAAAPRGCACGTALKGALFTQPDAMNKVTVGKLDLLIRKYVG